MPWCTYAIAETGKGFCCDNGNVKIEIENPSEAAKGIINIWKEDSPRGKVLQKYLRQLNITFSLEYFCWKKLVLIIYCQFSKILFKIRFVLL